MRRMLQIGGAPYCHAIQNGGGHRVNLRVATIRGSKTSRDGRKNKCGISGWASQENEVDGSTFLSINSEGCDTCANGNA